MAGKQTWIDDRLVPAAEATVSAYDRAFRAGEGVFETFRTYGRHVFRMREHLERAASGAEVLGFSLPPLDQLAAAVQATVDANVAPDADAAARLVASPGAIDPDSPFPGAPMGKPTIVVTVHDLVVDPAVREHGVSAILVPWGREVAHVKAVSYLASVLARRQARAEGADDALLTDADDNVLEAASANLFAVIHGVLVTPAVDGSILPGVTRQVVLEVARSEGLVVAERPIHLKDLQRAREAFLTASTREITPLVRIGDRDVGDGRPGATTRRLIAAFDRLVASEAAGGQDPRG